MKKRQTTRRKNARRFVARQAVFDDARDDKSGRKGGKPAKRKRGGIAAGKKPRFRADKPRRAGGGSIQVGPVGQNLPPPLTDEQKQATWERVDQGLENLGGNLTAHSHRDPSETGSAESSA
jgi:hypothetical protein